MVCDSRSVRRSNADRDGSSVNAVSEAEIVRRALAVHRFLKEGAAKDGEVMLRRADGQLERLVSF